MDISEHDSKIQAAKDEKLGLHSEMEDLILRFIDTCTAFFMNEYPTMVEQAITRQPEVVESLGLDRLRTLKSELNDLVRNAPLIVTNALDNDNLWEHRNELPQWESHESLPGLDLRQKAGARASKSLNEIMGHVGTLLLRYRLATAG